MEADFSGWASKAGVKCTDGRTIMPNAFQQQDKTQVPLVWQHGHSNIENVLGHAILENRPEGVWMEGFFNDSPQAVHARTIVAKKDVNALSIWANELVERAGRVLHGAIREVSIVLSGANPGALIENVTIRHSDGTTDLSDDEVIIWGGEIVHAAAGTHVMPDGTTMKNSDMPAANDSSPTVEDVYNTLNDEQQKLVHFMVGEAIAANSSPDTPDTSSAQHDNVDDKTNKEGTEVTTKNVFEQGADKGGELKHMMSKEDVKGILQDAMKGGSLRDAMEGYCLAHGINNISTLFPDPTALTAAPEFFGRRTEWVAGLLAGARKTPFARIKTHYADLNFDDARAKGYIKGNMKKEEFFGTASRITTPTTIYKKQKLDRDDIIDITDFDVVIWMRGEMRLMLEEEIARAILIGDGRAVDDEDKIIETNVRPIATDDPLYTIVVNVNLDDASSNMTEVIDALTMARQYYRGTGLPTMYTTETMIAKFLLIRDTLGRRIYPSVESIATELRVKEIVGVEVMDVNASILAVIVNMADYAIGADKGGQITNFDDFDIDFNQYKYLIETRISGALTRLKSAMVVKKTAAINVLVTTIPSPTFNTETGVVTIPAQTGVVYKNAVTTATLTAGAQTPLTNNQTLSVIATPATNFYFPSTEGDEWSFTFHTDLP